jgi:NADPH:quinone reductase-like Zn-dependent oxidoreductase
MRTVTVSEYGASPVVGEIPTPQPGAGQILLRMRAAGMNPMDRTLASGAWRPAPAIFPMVLGADGAGVVESLGEGARRFSRGEELFGQLLIAPLGSAGTYAEYVAVTEDAPLARVPDGLDPVLAAALPTAGVTALALTELPGPLSGKTVLIVGARGGIGSFATQFAVNAGARVIANVRAAAAGRMRGYGAAETIDHTEVSLPDAVRQAHPDGIDVLIDLVSDADGFAALASLVRPGGTAVTTLYVADPGALAAAGVTGTNFNLSQYMSGDLLERVAGALVGGRIVAPPVTRITLEQAPAALDPAQAGHADGKTVITL